MRFEGEYGQRGIRPRGMGRAQNGRVSEMHPVEIAEGYGRAPRFRRDRVVGADDANGHAVEMPASSAVSSRLPRNQPLD